MKAAYIKTPYQVEIREVALREIKEDEVLVKVKACGICGTDVSSIAHNALEWEPVGHEISGVVEQLGALVNGLGVGDTVTFETSTFCRVCENCRNGRYDLCNSGATFWLKGTMGFADYIIVPMECVVKYEGLSFAAATLIEPLGVALDLVYTADVKLNDDVLVVGLGPIGLMAIRLAKLMGARKIYAAVRSHSTRRAELAKQFGADEVLFTDVKALTEYCFEKEGVDKILITAPPMTIPEALKVANVGAIIAFLGIEYGVGATISFDANDFHFKKMQLRGAFASPALYFPRCIDLLKSGAIDADALISHTFKLGELEQAFIKLRDEKATAVKMVMIDE